MVIENENRESFLKGELVGFSVDNEERVKVFLQLGEGGKARCVIEYDKEMTLEERRSFPAPAQLFRMVLSEVGGSLSSEGMTMNKVTHNARDVFDENWNLKT